MAGGQKPYRILHILRAPVGGLFRHVCDLASEQAARGNQVGIICDATTGGGRAEQALAAVQANCALGVARIPIGKFPGLTDIAAIRAVSRIAARTGAGILHGHGAKGGAYARLARAPAKRFYTPHGGSLHYARTTPAGFVFLFLERYLLGRTDGLIFESDYGRRIFVEKVGTPRCAVRVVHNGLRPEEFKPIKSAAKAADLLFIGEMRDLKGVATLLRALAICARQGNPLQTLFVGDGPDRAQFVALAGELGLKRHTRFAGAMPAREAFSRAGVTVIPSLAESLPYIVLEAAAAGVPLIATNVGGIPEIFGPDSSALVPPGDPAALADAIAATFANSGAVDTRTKRLRKRIKNDFSLQSMCDGILRLYGNEET